MMPAGITPDPQRDRTRKRDQKYARRYRARQRTQKQVEIGAESVTSGHANLAPFTPLSDTAKRRRDRHRQRKYRARKRWQNAKWSDMRIRTLEELIAAFRSRREELHLTQMALDDIAGLQDGYCGKIEAGPIRGRSFGEVSLPLILDALGVRIILVPRDK